MNIAIAQTEILFESQQTNLQFAADWITQASKNKADCIFFPEMSFTGFSMHAEKIASLSKAVPQTMQNLAKTYAIAIGFGYVSANANGTYGNHYQICDKNGDILLDYTKVHPFSYSGEDQFYQGGTDIVTAELCGLPISTILCYDLRFPEIFRLAAKNASLVLVPANWLAQRSEHWQILLRARAIENQVYVLGINCVGMQEEQHFLGDSCLINPEGVILAACGNATQLRYIEIQNDIAIYRENFLTIKDARFDWYIRQYQEKMR